MPLYENGQDGIIKVTDYLFSNRTDSMAKQDQDCRSKLSPNVIRGTSTDSIRLFPLFEPADDFAQHAFPEQTSQENDQQPNVDQASAAERQHGAEDAATDAVACPEIILDRALQDAARCLQEARVEAEAIKTSAYQEGFQQGLNAGQEAIKQRFDSVMEGFCQATKDLLALRQGMINQAEEDIVTLACQLAAKIISREIQTQPDIFTTILHQALDRLALPDRIVVYVNPIDLRIAREQQGDLLQHFGEVRQLTIETDETIERGGCIVQTALGEIDARIDAQLKELEMGLRKQSHASTEDSPS